MSDPFASKGYVVLQGSSPIDLGTTPVFGFTTLEETVLSSVTHPPSMHGCAYSGDAADLAGRTLPAGLFYPIPATAITLTSGSAIGWLS